MNEGLDLTIRAIRFSIHNILFPSQGHFVAVDQAKLFQCRLAGKTHNEHAFMNPFLSEP